MKAMHQMIEDQVRRWEIFRHEDKKKAALPVITFSREPGSGGEIVAQTLATKLGLELFDETLVNAMAEDAHTSARVIRTLDERGLSMLDDWIAAAVSERHLWPDEFSRTLMRVIGTIGRHGNAIIIGRGANFVLPPQDRFRVRVIAPLEKRVNCVAETYGVSKEEAKKRVANTDTNRRAFIWKYFHCDISDPANYDLIVNTGTLSVTTAVETISSAIH